MRQAGKILKSLHVGVGGRSQWPIQRAIPAAGFAPTVLCDPSPAALESARAACDLDAACHSDLDATLSAAREQNCAIICAPTHLHVPLVKRCVEAGLTNALVDKGMAANGPDACELALRG